MTIAQADLVKRIRFHLGDFPWETLGSASSGISDITVEDGTEWVKGNIGEFEEDGDTFYVRSVAGLDLDASRGYYGSVGASHSSGSRIFKDPKYKFNEITNAITEVIEYQLPWPRAYKVVSDTLTPDAGSTVWYDLADDAQALIRVRQQRGTDDLEMQQYGLRHDTHRIAFETGMPTALVSSGVGIKFIDGFVHDSNTVYIDYASKITDSVTTASYDDFSAGDAVTSAIVFGAVALLQDSLELRKPRRPTPDTNFINGGVLFFRRFQNALANTEKELRQKHPLMT